MMRKIFLPWMRRRLVLFGLVVLTACGTPSVYFSPDDSNRGGTLPMTSQEARRVLAEIVRSEPSAPTCKECRVSVVRTTLSTIYMRWDDGSELKLPLTQLGHLYCEGRDKGIYVSGYLHCRSDNGRLLHIHWTQATPGLPIRLASAIHALEREAQRFFSQENEKQFQLALQQYRTTAQQSPPPTAGVDRLMAQAQAAVKEKDFISAAELYLQVGQMAPWWPAGHFDAALILAETGDYSFAIQEMNRYLALVPDAPNARAAQQQVYEWERKASASN